MEITNLTELFQMHYKYFSSYLSVAFQFLMKSSESAGVLIFACLLVLCVYCYFLNQVFERHSGRDSL